MNATGVCTEVIFFLPRAALYPKPVTFQFLFLFLVPYFGKRNGEDKSRVRLRGWVGRKMKRRQRKEWGRRACALQRTPCSEYSLTQQPNEDFKEAAAPRNSSRWLSLVPSVDPVSLFSAVNT